MGNWKRCDYLILIGVKKVMLDGDARQVSCSHVSTFCTDRYVAFASFMPFRLKTLCASSAVMI
jgi:hypothetical protein